ncbi:MAG: 2-isopropylmalate synthase [Syntrophales bacterium]|nr:2-isopropylmalate synthase [Syntrophales bacterium]
MKERRLFIFDTTLRDGEQSPGCGMLPGEKLRMARQLETLGVDVIEAGFPVSSPGEFNAVRKIAKEVRGTQIAAITRAKIADIDRTWEAIREGSDPRIHIILSSSDIHLQYQLKKSRKEILKAACIAVAHARTYTENVEFSPMDATRTDRRFLCTLLEWVIAAGASVVSIADTVGYAIPSEFGELIRHITENVGNLGDHILSVHCHDDLGLAVANTLAAVEAGVRQVKCTVNGIGERAGNAALEEVVMALKTRNDRFGVEMGIHTEELYRTSQLLTEITGISVQPNKAVVGANAFAHGAGIHQDGLLKDTRTYEIMTPQSAGVPESRFILGKHSGSHAIRDHIERRGDKISEQQLNYIMILFKEMADYRKNMTAADLDAIIGRLEGAPREVERRE